MQAGGRSRDLQLRALDGWGLLVGDLRSRLFFQTFIFTDGEDEALAKLTGWSQAWEWGWGSSSQATSSPEAVRSPAAAVGLRGQFTGLVCLMPRPPLLGP